jgi:hypothetical protein
MTEGGAARGQQAGKVSHSRPPVASLRAPALSGEKCQSRQHREQHHESRAHPIHLLPGASESGLVRSRRAPAGRGRGPSLVRLGR